MVILEQYSNRTLSYSSESLNAFLGILSSFGARKEPIYHVWGVALVFEHRAWSLKLNWKHRHPSKRCSQFPSWSWAGWWGPLARGKEYSFVSRDLFYAELEEDNRGEDSGLIDLQTFGDEHGKYRMYATGSPYIRLTVQKVDLVFTHVSWSSFSDATKQAYYNALKPDDESLGEDAFKEGLYAQLPRRGYTELAYFYIDDMDFDTGSLDGKSLATMMYEEDLTSFAMTFIVIAHLEEDRYERLGYVLSQPFRPKPTADTAFRLGNGRMSKVRPDIAPSDGEPEQLFWRTEAREMSIRLG